jgi:arsenate reductase-like glutaredoxin family protein
MEEFEFRQLNINCSYSKSKKVVKFLMEKCYQFVCNTNFGDAHINLFYDNHESYVFDNVSEFCKNNKIDYTVNKVLKNPLYLL